MFCLNSAIEPGVTLALAGGGFWSLLLQAATIASAAMAAMALIIRISVLHGRFMRLAPLKSHPRTPRQTRPERKIHARAVVRDNIPHYCGIKGDHAGSEASVGVGTC